MTFRQRLVAFIQMPFVYFTLLTIAKLLCVQTVVFHDADLLLSVLAGIPPVWFFFLLIESVFRRRKRIAYFVVDLLLTCIYFAVIMYYKYFGVIVTYHELRQVNQVGEVKSSVISLMDPYFLLIFADLLVLAGVWTLGRRRRIRNRSAQSERPGRRLWPVMGLAVMVLVCVFTILPFKDGMNEFRQAEGMGVINYEAYKAFSGPKDVPVDESEIDPAYVASLKGAGQPDAPAYWQAAKGKNVIIIQLEAFQNFLIDAKIDGKAITPNMNKLAHGSFYFPHFFQQVGQGNTADAEYVVNTSLHVPTNGAASEVNADKALPSAPKVFAANGYRTATFHTNDVTFWNRKNLYQALGWQKYYDKTFFGDEDQVMFSSSDEVLYKKTADELARYQQEGAPFYVQVISMSGHHPFTIPARKYKMTLPARYEGTMVGDYIRAQNYADFALGQFIDELKANGVWDNSVVVLYGDHQGLPIYSLNQHERELMKEIYGRDYEVPDMMNIPLVVSVPGQNPQVMPQVGGQSDIFPTVANLAGISIRDQMHFGQDILNHTDNVLPERYYLPTGSLITGTGTFVPGEGFGDGVTYPLNGGKSDKPLVRKDQYDMALKLLSISDRFVASLPEWRDQDK